MQGSYPQSGRLFLISKNWVPVWLYLMFMSGTTECKDTSPHTVDTKTPNTDSDSCDWQVGIFTYRLLFLSAAVNTE